MSRTRYSWYVNDLLAYGMVFGWSTFGVMGCLVCMDDIRVFHLQHDKKACYFYWHRQFFSHNHPYSKNKKTFITKSRVERKVAYLRLIGEQICDWGVEFSPTVEVPLILLPGYCSEDKLIKKNIY
ncbi:UNVERIFIED_CONTAM: hypothetical protein Scaly_2488700 [Sesamum calycinum]|uniref:Uncharacterized protein n=1 Tax=Sesamum calycinum TaxID=2727403 RepID=A0AAW2LUH8_9LAMI